MQSENKFFSDLAKLGQSAAGSIHGVKSEVESQFKSRIESFLKDMDLVTREEYEVVKEMAIKAREENIELFNRLEMLEKQINTPKSKIKKT
jgi:BMFP domain-containing protein YqiC